MWRDASIYAYLKPADFIELSGCHPHPNDDVMRRHIEHALDLVDRWVRRMPAPRAYVVAPNIKDRRARWMYEHAFDILTSRFQMSFVTSESVERILRHAPVFADINPPPFPLWEYSATKETFAYLFLPAQMRGQEVFHNAWKLATDRHIKVVTWKFYIEVTPNPLPVP